ncbi:MAG: sigma-54-dependent Fis family transcriptional regulator [Rhodospirillales bacterium 20-60-12]|nr:MAG: sigma-54-dependent Fis family transcriptional regulator [Rhodospirillales bacterium 20-60-12]HQT68119.1 sigma-54 dependent transcriptional regulator [Acetobacteraceae bacterium]
MRVLIIGSLNGELGVAARIAMTRGAALDHAQDIAGALRCLRSEARVDLVLCDVSRNIGDLIAALKAERFAVPVVAAGMNNDEAEAIRAIQAGAREFLPLPPDPELIAAILAAAAGDTHQIIARDPMMLAALARAEQVARADASILITGESGTGKEVLAQFIHRKSKRADGPFIALNCAAIPETLLESELFGHEKGAFSGALARRIGKFEAAQGGTLLLDEISEMDIRLQAKLLRAVQEREIDRVGGAGPIRVNVRILATTNRHLPDEIAAGRFREDLFFRLNVVALRIPPLRDRPNDIPALAQFFADHYADLNGVARKSIAASAYSKLALYRWRGNVRELENVMHRAVLLSTSSSIEEDGIELVNADIKHDKAGVAQPVAPASGHIVAGLVGRRMEDVEQQLIIETLHHCLGNRTHAATILGISIRALRNKLRDYSAHGLNVPPPSAGVAA